MASPAERGESKFPAPAPLRMSMETPVGQLPPELELGVSMEIALEALNRSGLFDVRESSVYGGERAFLIMSKPRFEPLVSFVLVQESGDKIYVHPQMHRNLGLPLVHYLRARIDNPALFQADQNKPRPDDPIHYQDERLRFDGNIDELARKLQDSGLFQVEERNAYRPGSNRIIVIATTPPSAQPNIFGQLIELEERHGGGVFLCFVSDEDTKNAVIWKAYIDAVLASSSNAEV